LGAASSSLLALVTVASATRPDEMEEIIKKTRFGEIINGLRQGGAYAFDQEAYGRFLPLAQLNGMNGLDVLRKVKEIEHDLKVIMVTVEQDKDKKVIVFKKKKRKGYKLRKGHRQPYTALEIKEITL